MLLALIVLVASCDSGSSKSASKSKPHATPTTSSPAKNTAATPTGADAAIAAYVKSRGFEYAGDCATAKLPQDKGKWCSTLVSGDDKSETQTYDVGPVGEKPQKRITLKRRGLEQLTPGYQVGVAEGNVGQAQQLTRDQLLGDVWITGNLLLDQIAGIGNGLADLPAGAPTGGGTPTGNGAPPPPTTTAPPSVIGEPTTAPSEYPPTGGIVVVSPNVTPGGEVAFRGSGCAASEQLSVLFDGVQIGTLLSDAQGNFAGNIKVPVGTPPGQHVLTVRGASCELNVTITVAGNLAFSGASNHTMTYVLAGIAAVVFGTILVVGSRRRRRAGPSSTIATVPRLKNAVSFGPDIDERIELLRGIWLFSACTDDELGRIAALAHVREATAGEEVTVEGEAGLEFFVVVDGRASASVDGKNLGTVEPGGFFGEMALIDGGDRVATVTALTEMQLLVLDRHDFNEMLELAMPEVAPKLLAVVGARMRAIEARTGVESTLGL